LLVHSHLALPSLSSGSTPPFPTHGCLSFIAVALGPSGFRGRFGGCASRSGLLRGGSDLRRQLSSLPHPGHFIRLLRLHPTPPCSLAPSITGVHGLGPIAVRVAADAVSAAPAAMGLSPFEAHDCSVASAGPCSTPVRCKAFTCCAASSRLVVLARVDFMFDFWMQPLIRRLYRGVCLSPVSLISYLRLSLQPLELRCTREVFGGLCRHCPVVVFTVFPMGHLKDIADTFGRFKFGELIQIYLLCFCS
jgi:hypothetical protein